MLCLYSECIIFFFLMIRRPPRSTLFPPRRSSDLGIDLEGEEVCADLGTPQGRVSAMNTVLDLTNRVIDGLVLTDRKSTRLNSSHSQISYAVFCLKNKNVVVAELNAVE